MSYKWIITIITTALLLFAGLAVFLFYTREETEPEPREITMPQQRQTESDQKVYGWIPYWDGEAVNSFYENSDKIDGIGLFWYKLTEDGQIQPYQETVEDLRIIEHAHERDIEVYALVANLPEEGEQAQDWDAVRVERVIANEEARSQHIEDLVNLVVYKNFDGLALDYENLEVSQRDNFSQFVEELAQRLHNNNKTLEIAIHPKTSDNQATQFEGAIAQDYTELAKHADGLHFMMYTQNGIHSSPAPPVTIDWTESVLDYAQQSGVPQEKIILGVGLFGTHWQIENNNFQGTSSDLTFNQIQAEIQNIENVNIVRDVRTQSVEATYQRDDLFHVVWYNDAQSIKKMQELARNHNLVGISLWRLGGEDENVWDIIEK